MNELTIAIPTGRLGKEVLGILEDSRVISKPVMDSRKLEYVDEVNNIRLMFIKPSDVITYVERGITDIGIVGKDSILEDQPDVYELLDLQIGICKFVVAGMEGTSIFKKEEPLVVATKYPNVTKDFFKRYNQEVEIIKLNGSVEVAPLVNLSDVILDIFQTGKTLEANGLSVLEDVTDISARLISNKVSYRFKKRRITEVISQLRK
jgi:ATP phosphoribosyltransferase